MLLRWFITKTTLASGSMRDIASSSEYPSADPVEKLDGAPRQVVADAEVRPGVERRHDLAGMTLDPADEHVSRDAGSLREVLDRLHHPGVVRQPVDQDLALRLLERGYP